MTETVVVIGGLAIDPGAQILSPELDTTRPHHIQAEQIVSELVSSHIQT